MAFSFNGTAQRAEYLGTNGGTGTATDLSGCDLVIVSVLTIVGSLPSTETDSQGNTWNLVATYTSNGQHNLDVYYWKNPSVSASHTVTISGTGSAPVYSIVGFTGADLTAPNDQHNGNAGVFLDTLATGSITPSANNCLIVSPLLYSRSQGGAYPVDSGMTVIHRDEASTFCITAAYKIQTTAAAINVTWGPPSLTGSVYIADAVVSFLSAGGAPASPTYPQLERGIRGLARGVAGGIARTFERRGRILVPSYAVLGDLKAAA